MRITYVSWGFHKSKEAVCVLVSDLTDLNMPMFVVAIQVDLCQKIDGSWQVDGVASYVYTYCKYYTAYAPVNKYVPWIKQYVSDL